MATALAVRTTTANNVLFAELGQAQQSLESCSNKLVELSAVEAEIFTVTNTATVYDTLTVSTVSTVTHTLPQATIVAIPTPHDDSIAH